MSEIISIADHKKALSPQSLIKTLFTEDVLTVIRRKLNKSGEVRLDFEDIIASIKDVLSKDAIMAAGDIGFKKSKKKKKRSKNDNNINNGESNTPSDENGEEETNETSIEIVDSHVEDQKSDEITNVENN